MTATYAVKWREADGPVLMGRLELGRGGLVFEGPRNGEPAITLTIPYAELTGFRIGRDADERLDGRPTLIVERPRGDVVLTSTMIQAGVLQELADRLGELLVGLRRRVTIVVPLREGAAEQARRLAERGPPFDPSEALLTRHELLLTDQEAIFVFEADAGTALEGLIGQLDLWSAAVAWQDLIAGPPRLAEAAYTWEGGHVAFPLGLGL